MTALTAVALTFTWVLLAGALWFAFKLLQQNGRLLNRVEAIEQALDRIGAGGAVRHAGGPGARALERSRINRNGLAPGTPAPAFRLPRVDGGELSLDDYHGRAVLLVFSDPECGPCDTLAPKLERLARRVPDIQVVMVSRGDAGANRKKIAQHGLTFPVVLQRHWEISRAYGKFVTPMAYLIDSRGTIVANVAVGVDAILALPSLATADVRSWMVRATSETLVRH